MDLAPLELGGKGYNTLRQADKSEGEATLPRSPDFDIDFPRF